MHTRANSDVIQLLRRNPRFRKINDKVHDYFHFERHKKSNSMKPITIADDTKDNTPEGYFNNEYMTIQKEYSPTNKFGVKETAKRRTCSTGAPSLFGVDKKQKMNAETIDRSSRVQKIIKNQMSVKKPPILENISVMSPNGVPKTTNHR